MSVIPTLDAGSVVATVVPTLGGGGGPPAAAEFIFSVKSDNVGTSNNDQFTIRLDGASTYNFDWSDSDGGSGTHTTNADLTITFASGAGTYTITIGGTNNTFPTMKYAFGGDRKKFLDISQWGTGAWQTWDSTFFGCENLTISATDSPNLDECVSGFQALYFCNSIVEFPAFNMPICTTIDSMYRDCTLLETIGEITTSNLLLSTAFMARDSSALTSMNISSLDTSSVTTMRQMFMATGIDIDVSGLSILSLTTAQEMMQNSSFSQTNYDLLLVAWEGQTHNDTVPLHAGAATYSAGAPATAHAALVSDSWTLTDGGPA